MNWQKERDLLIAQTMAFVQSVTGKAAGAAVSGEAIPLTGLSSLTEPVSLEFAEAEPRLEVPATTRSVVSHGDMREEILGRVAAFRARQQLFNRDRDEYCNATLAKARAMTGRTTAAPDHPPVEH